MDESILMKYGMKQVTSSELVNVRGGISFEMIKKLLELATQIVSFTQEYWGDFKRGFDKGWEMA